MSLIKTCWEICMNFLDDFFLVLEACFGFWIWWQTVVSTFCRVLKNTKEYLCGAMVTVVDHLGNVSANLESLISQANTFCEAESHINCLKQVSTYWIFFYIYDYITRSNLSMISYWSWCLLTESAYMWTICSYPCSLQSAVEWKFTKIPFTLLIIL